MDHLGTARLALAHAPGSRRLTASLRRPMLAAFAVAAVFPHQEVNVMQASGISPTLALMEKLTGAWIA